MSNRAAHVLATAPAPPPIPPGPVAALATVAPHPTLTDYYPADADKRQFLRGIFDDAANEYDRVESAVSFGSGRWYRRRCLKVAGLTAGMSVLDVAMGTGLVAREARAMVTDTGRVYGVDPSPGMLAAARSAGVPGILGVAEALPVGSDAFDVVSMGYALRHVPDLSTAFAEMRRVLRPGGRLCILEVTAPESGLGRWALGAYFRVAMPAMEIALRTSVETRRLWRYYWKTIEACVAPERVLAALRTAGFADVTRRVELGVFSCYLARKPS
jgi:demethylmenaquinone methyltransferase/2-methoxy-6-polyprenyl-1,4-benzoquinol methylase